jgi:hypothetical protein
MNSEITSTVILATGQSIPFTGNWYSIAQARNTLFVAYASGAGVTGTTINVQAQTSLQGYDPTFNAGGINESINLYSFTGVTVGYQSPALMTSPVGNIRITATGGAGQIFAYAIIQN